MFKKTLIILAHAFVGWGLCGATMFAGMNLFSMDTAVLLHAAAAPVIFFGISLLYFKKFAYTSPRATAAIFVGFIIAMDVFVVAMLIEKSFAMFASPLGTWIPFALIFSSTWATGRWIVPSS